jgi:hypothetical protein
MIGQSGVREHVITARLNDEELEKFEAARQIFGLSQAKYVRARVLAEVLPVVIPEANLLVWKELGHVGGNLNQLTRSFNILAKKFWSSASPLSAAEVDSILEMVKDTKEILNVYRRLLLVPSERNES